MAVIKITEENFEKEVLQSDRPVLADFNADWCGPCKMLAPIVHEISDENQNIKVVSINIDDESELANDYDVNAIPCLILFKDGSEIDRSVGFKPKDDILEFIGEI